MLQRSLFVIIIVLWCSRLSAQSISLPYSPHEYDFIDYDSSYLENFGDNPNLSRFFEKLSSLYFDGEGQVNVVQLGGSHVQGGVWPWCLRRHFESLCYENVGSYGLVFPFKVDKSNHPYFYICNVEGKWQSAKITKNADEKTIGLAGAVAYTYDSIAKISFKFSDFSKHEERFYNRIKILHDTADTAFIVHTNADSLIVDCMTDYSDGYTEIVFSTMLDTLSLEFVREDSVNNGIHLYGVIADNDLPGICYTGIGINGASTESYIKAPLLLEQIQMLKPDLLIFSIGVNDASGPNFTTSKYVSNYKRIVNKILETNPDCAIIFTTNNDFYNYRKGVNVNQPKVYDGMVELAKYYDASVWNMYRVMGGYKSINTWLKADLAKKDRIHFTTKGYNVLGGLLFDAILREYEKTLSK